MSATDTAAPVRLPDLASPPADIAQALVDVPSVSGSEGPLADAVEAALGDLDHLEVLRHGNTVVARTHLGRPQRVVVAGHLDTVPVSLRSRNVPGRREERDGQEVIWGRGSVDMKGGVAVALHLAATLTHPGKDVTWVLYDNEEVAAHLNGLGRVLATHPDWLAGDLAVLGEPTASRIEGGCNGTLRLVLDVRGVTAHSARAWRGVNAVHAAAPLIQRVATAPVHEVEVEGLVFRESFSVVGIQGGTATNSVPDACRLTVNYRFAPDLTALEALERALLVLAGHDPGPRPGRLPGGRPTAPAAQALSGRTGTMPGTVEVSSPAARAVLDAAPPLVVGAVGQGAGGPGARPRRHRRPQVRVDRRGPLLRHRRPRPQPGPGRPHALPHRRRALPGAPDPGRGRDPAQLAVLSPGGGGTRPGEHAPVRDLTRAGLGAA